MSKFVCVMLAGGKGKRMGGKVSKQFLLLNDKPILYYSLKAFEPYVDEIVLVSAKGEEEYCRSEIVEKYSIEKVVDVVNKEYLALGFEKVMGDKKKDLLPLNKKALEAGEKALSL